MKTGTGLVTYAKAQLGKPYWWGTFGQLASAELLSQKRKQYPVYYQATDFQQQFGQKVHDCVGLIKGYLWCDTPSSIPIYNPSQDVAVSGLYLACKKHGNIGTLPEEPGVCVFQANMGHVGVYIGNGKVIEAQGHARGVIETQLKNGNWALWGKPRWITYTSQDSQSPSIKPSETPRQNTYFETMQVNLPLLKFGSSGIAVEKLQALLLLEPRVREYIENSGGKDGTFGEGTRKAVTEYQILKQLTVDGEAGSQVWSSLITT